MYKCYGVHILSSYSNFSQFYRHTSHFSDLFIKSLALKVCHNVRAIQDSSQEKFSNFEVTKQKRLLIYNLSLTYNVLFLFRRSCLSSLATQLKLVMMIVRWKEQKCWGTHKLLMQCGERYMTKNVVHSTCRKILCIHVAHVVFALIALEFILLILC